jgi:hypothetical protein
MHDYRKVPVSTPGDMGARGDERRKSGKAEKQKHRGWLILEGKVKTVGIRVEMRNRLPEVGR